MFKPMEAARRAGKFNSFDQLAKRLIAENSSLEWPASRALAVKAGDIDRGDRVWWMRREAQSAALAVLLDVPLTDLGLHEKLEGNLFEFSTFPELPPVALESEAYCEIGYVDGNGNRDGNDALSFWSSTSPLRHAWQGPEYRISWLQFQPGSGLSFYWAALTARTRHEHISARRLADVNERLRLPGNLILHVEQPCDDADVLALGQMHPELSLLIIASFDAPTFVDDPSIPFWLPAWDVLTGQADNCLPSLSDIHDGLAKYIWRLHDDWQSRLLMWVENRMGRVTGDTLLTARGVAGWLSNFPPGWQFVKGPADLLAVCRLCHLSPETSLPRVSDTDAGQRLLKRATGADGAISQRFTALVMSRLDECSLPWRGALSATQWATLVPALTSVPDEATLLEIANATTVTARRQRARALSERIRDKGLAPLIEARLLVATQVDALMLAPRFLVDLVARDRLMQTIRDEPVRHWTKYCHDAERRMLVDAALGSMSADQLLIVLDRLKALPTRSLAAIAGGEALFREIGKRISGTSPVPATFGCLSEMVLPRLAVDGFLPQPWTRPADEWEEELEWASVCWAWSLWHPAPPFDMPEHWAWHFPGWTPQLEDAEMPSLWRLDLPDGPALSHDWQRMVAVAMRLARTITCPPANPPEFLEPMLLMEALRGRWSVNTSWVARVLGHNKRRSSEAIEQLMLDEMVQIGPAAALRLLPAMMDFILADLTDRIRSMLVHRSRMRTWILQNITFPEAVSCLSDRQLQAMCMAPHALPPHLLEGMLLDPDTVLPNLLEYRMDAIRALDANHVDTLSCLLATRTLGMLAARRLWTVAPEVAERLLLEDFDARAPASLKCLIVSAPLERTGSVAQAILGRAHMLPADELTFWALSRLPSAGADAYVIGRILELDNDLPFVPARVE